MPHDDDRRQQVITRTPDEEDVEKVWVDYRSRRWERNIHKWRKAWDFYTAEVLGRPTRYIIRRIQGETEEAWQERARLADFGGHLATVADKFVGMLHTAGDEDTQRTWQPEEAGAGLGDPKDPASVAARLTENYDGNQTDLEAFWKQVASYLTVLHECWIVVDGVITRERGDVQEVIQEPRVRALKPQSVVNTFERNGSLEAVLVEEQVDARSSIREVPAMITQYVLYYPDRFERYRVESEEQEDGKTKRNVQMVGEPTLYAEDETPFVDRSGNEVPPIFRAQLPFKRHIGWFGAEKEQAIFNKESERDFADRMSSFSKLVPEESVGDDMWEHETKEIIRGSTVLQEPWKYINPSPAPVESSSEILAQKVETFYRVLFQKFEDEAAQATATAIRQQAFSGQDSFLNTLAGSLDEAEQTAMWLMGQIEFPGADGEVWGGFEVKRPRSFDPVDPNERAAGLRDRYYGRTTPVPIGRSGKVNVAKEIAEADGIPVDDEELEQSVETMEALQEARQAAGATRGVNV